MHRLHRLPAAHLALALAAGLAATWTAPRPAPGRVGPELEGHTALRAAALERLAAAQEVDPQGLLVTSAGAAHVIAGAPPAPRTSEGELLGLMLLEGQGPWRGGEGLPDGVYRVGRGTGPRIVELRDEAGQVAASFTLDFPTAGDGTAAVRWPRLYLAIARDLIPSAR